MSVFLASDWTTGGQVIEVPKHAEFKTRHLGIMLGKRKRQLQYKSKKTRKNPALRQLEFGKGYNPKKVSLRKPPPNAELKYHDHGQPYTTLTNVSTAQIPAYFQEESMITIPRGDQPNQRNGRKIMIRDVDLRIGVQIDRNSVAGVANVGNLVCGDSTWRIVMYLDTQCNQATAPINEVFEMTTSNEHPIDSFNNLNTEGRFKILWDKFINLRANQNAHLVSADGGNSVIEFDGAQAEYRKHVTLNLPVVYRDSDEGDVNDIKTNNIGFFVMCTSPGGHDTATQRKTAFKYRVRFLDY